MCAVPSNRLPSQMRAEIEKTIHGKNTLGGVLEIVALNVPVGLGSFVQWDKRLEAKLAMAVMSVQAIKGVEVGDAFANAKLPGTQAHDPITLDGQRSNVERLSNRAGGTEGGVSNGQPIIVRAAMKPIATTLLPSRQLIWRPGPNLPPDMNAPISARSTRCSNIGSDGCLCFGRRADRKT